MRGRRRATRAIPTPVRAICIHRMMGIITTGARPIVIAVGIFFDHGGTLRAINPSAIAVGIQCEILFTGRAIPDVFANNGFGRIVSFP